MKRKDRYIYPAIFSYEEGFKIAVTFPDLPGCTTCGADDAEALEKAKAVLGGHLWCLEVDNDDIPEPTRLSDVHIHPNEQAGLVEVYMPSVRLAQINKSVSRTVTLPAWLNAAALEKGINFSQALQNTLINDYGIIK